MALTRSFAISARTSLRVIRTQPSRLLTRSFSSSRPLQNKSYLDKFIAQAKSSSWILPVVALTGSTWVLWTTGSQAFGKDKAIRASEKKLSLEEELRAARGPGK